MTRSVATPSRPASRAAATATGYQSLWPNSPAVRPRAASWPKFVPLESHSLTAEAFAATAFSTAQARPDPRQMPPREPAAGGVASASRRRTVGALAPSARADTPQPTLSRWKRSSRSSVAGPIGRGDHRKSMQWRARPRA
jgi:hypothetical protein